MKLWVRARRTDSVEHERDESMIPRKRQEIGVDKDNVFKVVDDRFAVEKVVCDNEKVPVRQLIRWLV